MKKTAKKIIILSAIGYAVYKFRLDKKIIHAVEPGCKELVASLKSKLKII